MKALIVVIGLLFFTACEKKASQSPDGAQDETIVRPNGLKISRDDIESIDYLDYALSRSAENAVAGWASYTELETLVLSIKNADLSYFNGDEEVMATFMSELHANIPEKAKNEAVSARITALETKFLKLKSAVVLSTTLKPELIASIKEFLEACSNLNLQINKKLEKESQDISKTNL